MDKQKNTAVGPEDGRVQLQNLAGRDNTCADLLSRIPRRLENESVGVEPGADDRAYLIRVINFNRRKKRFVLETDKDEDILTVTDKKLRTQR